MRNIAINEQKQQQKPQILRQDLGFTLQDLQQQNKFHDSAIIDPQYIHGQQIHSQIIHPPLY